MQLSIIIVNYKSWSYLDNLLTGIRSAEEISLQQWELIVVDNFSNDGVLPEFESKYAWVKFIQNVGNNGFANGNNLGADSACGNYLLFMNPDVEAHPQDIQNLLKEMEIHPGISILSAPQLSKQGRLQKSFDRFPDLLTYFRTVRNLLRIVAPGKNPNPRKQHDSIIDCDWISGSLVLLSRNDFDALGGWNEDYWMYAEDVDLCKRAENMGMRRAITPKAQFIHSHGGASRQNPEIAVVTKSEVMVSSHVYVEQHFNGIHKALNHFILGMRNFIPLLSGSVLNAVTLGKISKLDIRYRLMKNLFKHYVRVSRTGNWLSTRSVNFMKNSDS